MSSLLLLAVVSAEARPKKLTSTITWELQKDGTLVINGTGDMPSYETGDYPWKEYPWFKKKDTIKKVVINYGITSIGSYSFFVCPNLTSITIPNSVTKIENDAFYGLNLTNITIPDSVIFMESNAFVECKLTSVTINSITLFGKGVFFGCTGELIINSKIIEKDYDNDNRPIKSWLLGSEFTKLTIGDNITKIGKYAFSGCKSLTSVTIPKSVTKIGNSAFEDCKSLTSVTIPNSVTNIENEAFSGCSGELIINSKIIETDYDNDNRPIKSWLLGSKFTKLTIGDNITKIGKYAFDSCSGLTSVTIPNSVTKIGEWAFYDCKSLTSVTIPNSVTEIGWSTFEGCKSLTSVTIPNSVTNIDSGAFEYCSSLTSVTIPNSVTNIGSFAFNGCKSLTSVTIPNSVTNIGTGAFAGCLNLKNFYGKYASSDNRCLIVDSELVSFAAGLTNYTIPNSVTKIGEWAFYDCESLTSVTIPNSVTEIGNYAFYGCESLTSVTIPNSVTEIGNYAFNGCKSLTSVTIPNSVTEIGENAFVNTNIQELHIPNSVTYIGENAFGRKEYSYDLGKYNGKITNLPACVTRENYSKFGISKEAFETYMDNIGDPTAYVFMKKGDAYYDAKDYATALSYYLKGILAKKDGDYGNATLLCYMMAGRCCQHLNDYVSAITLYNKYYDYTDNKDIANWIADMYLKLNDYNSAIEWYKKGDKSNKEIAELYLKKNNYSGAIEMLSKDAEKGDKDCQYMLAEVYKKSGNKNKAIFWYKKAAEQKHLKAEEALADYGIFLTQQQSQSNKSPERTTQNTTTQPYTPQPSTPQIQYRQEWVDCQHCNGGRCIKCDGYGNSYSAGGYWHSCVHCYQGRCMWCEGRGGHYETRMY